MSSLTIRHLLRAVRATLLLLSTGCHIWILAAAKSGLQLGLHVPQSGRKLLSSEVAYVSTGSEFVDAFLNPAVQLVSLTTELVDVPSNLWALKAGSIPIFRTRNLTIEGNSGDWPSLNLNGATGVVSLLNGVTLAFRYLFLDGVTGSNPTPDQAFLPIAPSPPGPSGMVIVGPAAMPLPACFPLRYHAEMVQSLPRPKSLPGTQRAEPGIPQVGHCVNRTTAPALKRCWPLRGMLVDVASDAKSYEPGPDGSYSKPMNFIVWLRNVTGLCEAVVSEECVARKDTFVCFVEVLQSRGALAAERSEDDGGGSSRGRIAIPAAAASAGAAVLFALVGVAAWVWVRRRRRQRASDAGRDDIEGDSGSGGGMSYRNEQGPAAFAGAKAVEGSKGPSGAPTSNSSSDTPGAGAQGTHVGVVPAADKPVLPPALAAVALAAGPESFLEVVTPNTDKRASLELNIKVICRDDDTDRSTEVELPSCVDSGGERSAKEPGAAAQPAAAMSAAAAVAGGNESRQGAGGNGALGASVYCTSHSMPFSPSGNGEAGGGGVADAGDGGNGDGDVSRTGRTSAPKVLELLPVMRGRGAFGRVVEGLYGGQRVAVKLLPEHVEAVGVSIEEVYVQAFAQEVQVLGRCNHPNVVRLLAACVTPPRRCLVMELMETSLERLIHTNSEILPLHKVLHIGICISRALAYLHPTITHRDLKPGNVLINNAASERPVVKLTDFGMSRLRMTVAPTANPEAGTPPYMAPECFDPCNCRVSHHSDMYSLGVLLWEMLAGRRPWQGMTLMEIAIAVALNRQRPPLQQLSLSRCPTKLVKLLLSCWETDPARRPAAAEAAKIMTMQLQKLEQAETEPPPRPQ